MVAKPLSATTVRWQDVVAAYSIGMFPMADPADGSISWYAPDPRGIIELDRCVPPRSLRRTIRSGIFTIRWNTAFDDVVGACADREETWISRSIRSAYGELHRRGIAHSVETWEDGTLVGGLYGVSLGGAFFGESMFSRRTDASKVALVTLADRMRERQYTLLDAQFCTPHLAQFGCVEVSRQEYLERLHRALSETRRIFP